MEKKRFTFKYNVPPALRKSKDLKGVKKYPYIPIKFYSPHSRTPVIEGILDSGADGVHIPKYLADSLQLPTIDEVESHGVNGKFQSVITEIGLIVGRGGREVDFGIVEAVYPKEYSDTPVLIGRDPVFKEYQIIFEEYKEKKL